MAGKRPVDRRTLRSRAISIISREVTKLTRLQQGHPPSAHRPMLDRRDLKSMVDLVKALDASLLNDPDQGSHVRVASAIDVDADTLLEQFEESRSAWREGAAADEEDDDAEDDDEGSAA